MISICKIFRLLVLPISIRQLDSSISRILQDFPHSHKGDFNPYLNQSLLYQSCLNFVVFKKKEYMISFISLKGLKVNTNLTQ